MQGYKIPKKTSGTSSVTPKKLRSPTPGTETSVTATGPAHPDTSGASATSNATPAVTGESTSVSASRPKLFASSIPRATGSSLSRQKDTSSTQEARGHTQVSQPAADTTCSSSDPVPPFVRQQAADIGTGMFPEVDKPEVPLIFASSVDRDWFPIEGTQPTRVSSMCA